MADERSARQKALAEKKRRLEEIKARRQNRPGGGVGAASSSASTSTAAGGGGGGGGGGNNLDEYIDSLLKNPTPGQLSGVNDVSTTAVVVEEESKESTITADAAVVPSSVSEENNIIQGGGDNNNKNDAINNNIAPSPQQLQQQQHQPKVETFEIAIQCEEDDFPPPSLVDEDEAKDDNDYDNNNEEGDDDNNFDDANNSTGNAANISDNDQTNNAAATITLSTEEKQQLLSSTPFTHFLSTASKRVERLLGATDEGLMYGLLKEKGWGYTDFSMDYAQESKHDDNDAEDEEENELQAFQSGGFFTAKATYSCPKWTDGRNVTDIEWCPSHKEWVLASYNNVQQSSSSSAAAAAAAVATRNLSPNEQLSSTFTSSSIPNEGIVAIYNLTMPERPEHIFCSGCPIVHTQFHPVEHPKLILGGGTSGQVLVWDARVGRYPVQRSSTGGDSSGHDVELVGMKVLGGGAGSDGGSITGGGGSISTCKLVTASSDGKVNYWSVSNLRDPVETVIVDANLSCLDVLHCGSNEGVVCGDERGGVGVILASSGRDGGSGSGGTSKRVVRTIHPGGVFGDTSLDASLEGGDPANEGVESGHYGMVTAVAARPAIVNNGNTRSSMKESTSSMAVGGMSKGFLRGAGGLLITTGVDWSTKLWAPGYSDAPLMSFLNNSYDYLCDVQWSPVHPSIFATASSNGTVNIWNLATSLDQPISGTEGISIDTFSNNSTDPTSVAAGQGLNRLKWSADGRRMAVASGDKMHVLSVGEDVWKSKGDEEGNVMNNLLSRGLIHE